MIEADNIEATLVLNKIMTTNQKDKENPITLEYKKLSAKQKLIFDALTLKKPSIQTKGGYDLVLCFYTYIYNFNTKTQIRSFQTFGCIQATYEYFQIDQAENIYTLYKCKTPSIKKQIFKTDDLKKLAYFLLKEYTLIEILGRINYSKL